MIRFAQYLIEKRRPAVKFRKKTKEPFYFSDPPTMMDEFNAGVYKRYIREKEMLGVLKKAYGQSKITIEGIAQVYADHKICFYDDVYMNFSIKEVWPYREFDRDLQGKFSGSNSRETVEELRQSIKKEGIKETIMLIFDRDKKSGLTEVYLGEGNHRLGLAKELGLKTIKVRFSFMG